MLERVKSYRLVGEVATEFVGTLILILFGCGVVAQVVGGNLGGHDSIARAWWLGATLGVVASVRITGGHINPAVTIAFAAFRELPWRKVLPYCFAQTFGAFVGALLVRMDYDAILTKVDPGHTLKTQFVFSTLPGNGSLPAGEVAAFGDQIIGTAVLLFLVKALTDARNVKMPAWMPPILIGGIVVAIGVAIYKLLLERFLPEPTAAGQTEHSELQPAKAEV